MNGKILDSWFLDITDKFFSFFIDVIAIWCWTTWTISSSPFPLFSKLNCINYRIYDDCVCPFIFSRSVRGFPLQADTAVGPFLFVCVSVAVGTVPVTVDRAFACYCASTLEWRTVVMDGKCSRFIQIPSHAPRSQMLRFNTIPLRRYLFIWTRSVPTLTHTPLSKLRHREIIEKEEESWKKRASPFLRCSYLFGVQPHMFLTRRFSALSRLCVLPAFVTPRAPAPSLPDSYGELAVAAGERPKEDPTRQNSMCALETKTKDRECIAWPWSLDAVPTGLYHNTSGRGIKYKTVMPLLLNRAQLKIRVDWISRKTSF